MKYDYLSLHVRCNEILLKMLSSIDAYTRRNEALNIGKRVGLLGVLRDDQQHVFAAGEFLQSLRATGMIPRNKDMLRGVTEVLR